MRSALSYLISFLIIICCSEYVEAKSYKRIVALSPSVVDIVDALGKKDLLVGISDYSMLAKADKTIPKLGGPDDLSLETLLVLKPDIVISPYSVKIKSILQDKNLNLLILPESKSVQSIFESIITIGNLVDAGNEAEKIVRLLQEEIRKIRIKNKGKPKKKVLISVGRKAGSGNVSSVYSASDNTFLGDMVKIANGENIIKGQIAYPLLSNEAILWNQPDIIIEFLITTHLADQGKIEEKAKKDWQRSFEKPFVVKFIKDENSLVPSNRFIETLKLIDEYINE